jgi:tetratricopeptide (TPR) repeat protein
MNGSSALSALNRRPPGGAVWPGSASSRKQAYAFFLDVGSPFWKKHLFCPLAAEEKMRVSTDRFLRFLMAVTFFLGGCSAAIRGDAKLAAGDTQGAIGPYERYLEKHPDDARVASRLGFAYLQTGRPAAAVGTLEAAQALQPGDPYTLLYLGLAYLHQDRLDRAIVTWQAYRNRQQPLLEKEIRRQLTLLLMVRSRRAARAALAAEAARAIPKAAPGSIAVCPYADRSPDSRLGAFSRALAAMVISDLSTIEALTVVERVQLQALLQEVQLGQTGVVAAESAPRVGRLLGAENVVTGSLALGSITAVTAMIGKNEGTAAATVTEGRFFELSGRIASRVAELAGVTLAPEAQEALGAQHTSVYDAMLRYGEGLAELDAGNWAGAANLFAQAAALDPAFRLAREARDSVPRSFSPGVETLADLSGARLAAIVERGLAAARAEQQQADVLKMEMGKAGKCTG